MDNCFSEKWKGWQGRRAAAFGRRSAPTLPIAEISHVRIVVKLDGPKGS
jgi:hypothetical protein